MKLIDRIQWPLHILNVLVFHATTLVRLLSRKRRVEVANNGPRIGSFELLQTAGQVLELGRAALVRCGKLKPLDANGGFLDL